MVNGQRSDLEGTPRTGTLHKAYLVMHGARPGANGWRGGSRMHSYVLGMAAWEGVKLSCFPTNTCSFGHQADIMLGADCEKENALHDAHTSSSSSLSLYTYCIIPVDSSARLDSNRRTLYAAVASLHRHIYRLEANHDFLIWTRFICRRNHLLCWILAGTPLQS